MSTTRWCACGWLLLVLGGSAPVLAQPAPVVTTADGRRYDVTLDEVWLTARTAAARAVPPEAIPGTRRQGTQGTFDVFSLENVANAPELGQRMQALEDANPGREALLAVFERGADRTAANRALLGREVALLLNNADSPLPESLQGLDVTPFAAVAGAFIVRAADPLAAIEVADKLRNDPAVRSSYPLLRRLRVPR